jgi:hypothetical protein
VSDVSVRKIASPRREAAVSGIFGAVFAILHCSFPGRFANNLFGKAFFLGQDNWLVKDFAGLTWQ